MTVKSGDLITADLLNSLPVPMDTLTTGNVSNSAAETVIGTFAVGYPGGLATAPNFGMRFKVTGTWDCTATPTIQLRMRLNSLTGTVFYNTGALTANGANTSQPFWLDTWLMITASGSSGTADAGGLQFVANQNAALLQGNGATGLTFDTTASHIVVMTVQYGTANISNAARTLSGTMGRL